VVVDNASSDASAQAARAWPDVTVIEAGGNLGFARANNIGIRATTAPFLLLLNSDTIVPAGAVDRLLADLEAHPEAAAAGPRLVDAAGRAELSFGRMIGPLTELTRKLVGRAYANGNRLAVRYVNRRTSRARTPDWVSGACLLMRRADAEAVGLLDERYFMYTEDVDFAAALRARGREIRFTPAAEVIHLRGRSGVSNPGRTHDAYRRSQLAFYEKHHPFWAPWLRRYVRLTDRFGASRRDGS
jgi:hypothetical protein